MTIHPLFFPGRRTRHLCRARTLAFSLVEITLALGIVTFALVGVVGVLPIAMSASRQSFDKNRAAAIAGTLYTSFRSQPFQSVGYLDEQFDSNGQPLASHSPAPLDFNAANSAVQLYATFLDPSTSVTSASDPLGVQRHLRFASTKTGGADYLVTMHFNNQPLGTLITPVASMTPNGRPTVPAEANQVELVVSSVSRPADQYRFLSTVANRTN